jgi:predicted kinase
MTPSLECVILIGIPAAGKSTFYRRYFEATHRHVSKDLWPTVGNRDARQRREIAAALSTGLSVVVDNTNPTAASRHTIIDLARAHGARVTGYLFEVSTRQAVARNEGRTGPARVPKVAIFTAAKRLEPPVKAEGFDQLFTVQPGEAGEFVITERPE